MCPRGNSSSRRGPSLSWAGFSLIELLVVIAILMLLTTLFWGSGAAPSGKRRKGMKDCQLNLEKVYLALEIYGTDNAGKLPVVTGAQTSEDVLQLLVPRYTMDTSILLCPASDDSSLSSDSLQKQKISYAYYMGRHLSDTNDVLLSDRQVDTRSKNAGDLVFSADGKPPGNNHGKYGGNFLFGDGHFESGSTSAPFSLTYTGSVRLLNPKP